MIYFTAIRIPFSSIGNKGNTKVLIISPLKNLFNTFYFIIAVTEVFAC